VDRTGGRQADPPPVDLRTADLLAALSLATDLAMGLPAEHAVRSCYIGMHVADKLGLTVDQRADLYYTELLMDAGCTAWTSHFAASIVGDEIVARRDFLFSTDDRNPLDVLNWLRTYIATESPAPVRARHMLDFMLHAQEFMREGYRNSCEVAQRIARRLGMSEEVQRSLLSLVEQWDGAGPNGISGERIPLTSRIVYATYLLEACHSIGGRDAAIRLARRRRGTAFDPAVVDAFLAASTAPGFWEGLEQGPLWATVLDMEPDSPYRYFGEDRLEDVALCLADLADLKSFNSAGHSRRVADLAENTARQMRLPDPDVVTVRLAGLTHDLGLVAVPSFVLDKPRERLTHAEWESLRLHPYHAERILSKVSALERTTLIVGAHHERMDGQGYHRGLSGTQIPLGSRVVAVADRFDELTHDTPDQPALDREAALKCMGDEAGDGLCPDAFRAFVEALGAGARGAGAEAAKQPAGLAGRSYVS
jgi:HD-GYP domain-containing protein (c-di-GMP phosphodiesterase class II)